MRLIDTKTLRLVSKHDIDIPPYAILSHTWGTDDDEVSFEELQEFSASLLSQKTSRGIFTHSVTKKRGFLKIKEAARLAKSENHRYIWIDTCCINKSSSAELSEAINSMFRWYEKAAVCYAFLDDVHHNPGSEDHKFLTRENDDQYDETLLPAIVEALRSSRWFTRGWTLQELIAPANVHFYNSKWQLLGNKLGIRSNLPGPDKFPDLISDITGVDVDLLKGTLVLDEFSVARRMGWAARRETTRVEDKAYCLMGIFAVNMPLLYGEGERAFVRLQEEILKLTDDQSIFAWRCPWDDPLRFQLSGLLSPSPSFFATCGFDPLPRDTSRVSAPSTMTNAGLHIRLYLKPVSSAGDADGDGEERIDEFCGVLNCAPFISGDGQYYNAAILLTSLGGDQFARVSPESIISLPSRDLTLQQEGDSYRYIYVKQLPMYGLPDIVVERNIFQQGFLSSLRIPIRLLDIYPAENWNQTSFTLKPTATLPNSVLGAFRYALRHHDRSPGDAVDIFVGLAPGHDGSRRLWCIQQPVKGFPTSYHYLAVTAANFNSSQTIKKGRMVPIDECPHSHLLARVKTIRAHSRTNIFLSFSEIHESSSLLVSQSNTAGMAELEPGQDDGNMSGHHNTKHEATIIAAAEASTLEESWDTCLGFGILESDHKLLQSRIRISPRESKATRLPRKPKGAAGPRQVIGKPSFGSMFAEAKGIDITLEQDLVSREGSDMTQFRLYFSLLLTKACINNNVEAASELLRSPLSGAMVEVQTRLKPRVQDEELPWFIIFRRFRPIHWAAALGNREVLRVLLDYDADILSRTGTQLSAFHLAILMGHCELLQDLISALPEDWQDERLDWIGKNDAREPIAHLAAAYIRTSQVADVLARFLRAFDSMGFSYFTNSHHNTFRETPLHRAAAMGNYEAAKAIVGLAVVSSIDPLDHHDRTPLWHAAASGSHEIVELLLHHLANPNSPDSQGKTPLQVACRGGHAKTAEVLLEAGANTSGTIDCCHLALLSGDTETLEIFRKHGEDPSRLLVQDDIEVTPILVAVANGWLGCVKALCEAGSSTDVSWRSHHIILMHGEDSEGITFHRYPAGHFDTCIDVAIYYNQPEIERYLREFREEQRKEVVRIRHVPSTTSVGNGSGSMDFHPISEDEVEDNNDGNDSVSDLTDSDGQEVSDVDDDGLPMMIPIGPPTPARTSEPNLTSMFEEPSSDEEDKRAIDSTTVAVPQDNMI